MAVPPALMADLATLTVALDDPAADIADSLRQLATDSLTAVRSYLGLTVVVTGTDPEFTITALEGTAEPAHVRASLLVPQEREGSAGVRADVAVILFAGSAGAFVDLAADLAWLSGRELAEFVVDQHLQVAGYADLAGAVCIASVINQAIGVLIGRGRTPERAHRELDAMAAGSGTRQAAANLIMDTVSRSNGDAEV